MKIGVHIPKNTIIFQHSRPSNGYVLPANQSGMNCCSLQVNESRLDFVIYSSVLSAYWSRSVPLDPLFGGPLARPVYDSTGANTIEYILWILLPGSLSSSRSLMPGIFSSRDCVQHLRVLFYCSYYCNTVSGHSVNPRTTKASYCHLYILHGGIISLSAHMKDDLGIPLPGSRCNRDN